MDGFALQIKVSMHPRILHLLPNLVTNHINLVFRVLQHPREERVGERLETLHDLQVIPGADFLLRNKKKLNPVSKYVTAIAMQKTTLSFRMLGVGTYQMFVSRPGSHGPNVLLGLDVREPGLLHQCFENGSRTRFEAAFSGGHEEQLVEVFGSVFLGEGAVRRLPFQVEINVFNPSACLGMPNKDGN